MTAKISNQEAAVFIVKSFIRNAEMKSCDNCRNWDRRMNKCSIYNTVPPIEIILYSCGKPWVLDIPF
jgi:hypothetical protein